MSPSYEPKQSSCCTPICCKVFERHCDNPYCTGRAGEHPAELPQMSIVRKRRSSAEYHDSDSLRKADRCQTMFGKLGHSYWWGADTKTMSYIVFLISFFVSSMFSSCYQPHRATCPQGWWVEGIRPDGTTQCRPNQQDVPSDLPGGPDIPTDSRILPMWIQCNGEKEIPLVINERTVECVGYRQAIR